MAQPQLLLFDDRRGQWGPMLDLRAAFDLRTAGLTSRQRIERSLGRAVQALWTADAGCMGLLAAEYDQPINPETFGETVLAVNGRWAGVHHVQQIAALPPATALVQTDGQIIAAHLSAADAATLLPSAGPMGVLADHVQRTAVHDRVLLSRPWHILDDLEANLAHDLSTADLPPLPHGSRGTSAFGDHPVYCSEDAIVQPGAVFNTEKGPIVIASGALIGALAVIEGPCFIGRGTTVVCHAHLRPNTAIAPMCKVAGEVSYSIIDRCSNKAHHGYLGQSLVGQWANLGAATNVSNLKNTYGRVRVQLEEHASPQDTGRMFHGPIIGDLVRTAIGSRLLTGTCIGTAAMVAHGGYVPKFVPRLVFLTDHGARPYDMDKLIATFHRMLERRQHGLLPAVEQRLRALGAAGAPH